MRCGPGPIGRMRGPTCDGVFSETGLAASWPAQGPPLLWTRELGQGYSGFIVAEGKVFTQRQAAGGQYLVCLAPDTGQTIWEYHYDWTWQSRGAYPGPYATPTWYRGKIFYSSPTGLVGCVDAGTGAPLWSVNVRKRFAGPDHDFGYAATPLVEDDKVIVPVGKSPSVVALHVADGRTVWTAPPEPEQGDLGSYCSALPITFRGRRCVVGLLQNTFVIVDLTTGKLLHRQSLSTGYDEHSAWPIYREPHLLLTSPFRVPAQMLELRPGRDDGLTAVPLWTSQDLCNDIVSSVLAWDGKGDAKGGLVFGFDLKQQQASPHRPSRGSFKCLDWGTGKVRWATDKVGQASVLVGDGKLILFNDSGELILARADATEYHELGRVQLFEDAICWTPPTLWQGRLFLRGGTQAVCVYVGDPERLSSLNITTEVAHPRRTWRIDPTWLFSREREFPNDALSWQELTDWFAACLLFAFGGAALVSQLMKFRFALRRNRYFIIAPAISSRGPTDMRVFWTVVFILGVLGQNLLSAMLDRCLFIWPASLYAACHGTMRMCLWAGQDPANKRRRWLARLSMLCLVLVVYGYLELCKIAGMYIAWSFPFGFLPAFPLMMMAARGELLHKPLWRSAVWTLLAFVVYFWTVEALLLWKAGY